MVCVDAALYLVVDTGCAQTVKPLILVLCDNPTPLFTTTPEDQKDSDYVDYCRYVVLPKWRSSSLEAETYHDRGHTPYV